MPEWAEEALILSARPHGESGAIVTVLTADQGRHAGLVPGGAGSRLRGTLQPGNRVGAEWRARLPEQLGQL
ncbi:MAG TPA: DNA repair protein RecO, partial [Alphaproteobacteria bacterium]|nr:DNA repair protein RecO [Alphaproteobacteria bacterium]